MGPPRDVTDSMVVRQLLAYTLSAKEYDYIYQHVSIRLSNRLKDRAPKPSEYKALLDGRDDYITSAVRDALRVFLTSQAGLALWSLVVGKLMRRGIEQRCAIIAYDS